jgi:outer membrane protein assembly factor BamB
VYVVVPKQSQEDGTLVAYDVPTGDELWRYDTGPSGSSGYRAPSVAAADGRVYLAADELEALDAATGEQVWITEATERLKGAERNAPAVVDGTVYVGTGGHGGEFYAVSAADGSVEWTYEADSEVFSAAAVTQDTVYVSLTATDNPPEGVLALDATDGTKRWLNTEVASGKSPIRGAEYVYVGMAALSPDDGSVAWTLEERPGSSVAGDTLYAGGSSLLAVGGD